ncbi:MAG: zinc-ribbon domain-containing protein [Eubacterium sp.]|nr:zinc-ribbon domain-containing protein [Eubacterium sp.]
METDQFCPKCGTKAIRDRRCPDCGALLRDGVKFCPKCGRLVGEDGGAKKMSEDTLDIPIDAIERNILSETAAEIKADQRTQGASRKQASRSSSVSSAPARDRSMGGTSGKSAAGQGAPAKKRMADDEPLYRKRTADDESPRRKKPIEDEPSQRKKTADDKPLRRKKAADPEPPRRKKAIYRDDDWEDEDWEEDDWEDDDWDEDDDGEGVDVITIMTVVVGCVLLVVVAVLGFHLYRQYVPKNYERAAEEAQEEQDENEEQEPEGGQGTTAGDDRETTTLTVIHNVNVRDNPSTSGTSVIKVAQEGETYPCYGSAGDGEWYEILLEDGTIGYVFYEYVSVE